MCAAVVCVVFYVLTRSFELKSKLLWTFNKNIRRELQVGDFNISPLPMKWYKNWKDMWHFTAKKMTNIESNEKLVIKKKKTTQQNRCGMSNSTLPFYHDGHITEVHQLSTKSFLCTSTRLTPPGFFLKSVLNAFLR